MEEVVLRVKDLKVYYELGSSLAKAVDGVSFEVRKGECFGLVGESGSGKTTTAKAILRLLPPNGKLIGGSISLNSKEIPMLTEREMDGVRWREISVVTQSAMNALNPVKRIYHQMREIFTTHEPSYKDDDILEKCKKLFATVGLSENRIFDYPHQFSGGMRQRVIIAMAVALNPDLIIGDEPTTALDVMMQAQITNLLKSLSEEQGISIILITHDIAIVAEICQTVGVMYAGRLVEYGDIDKVFNNSYHPYTIGLKGAFPSIKDIRKTLVSIPGNPPVLITNTSNCGFSDRCPFSIKRCKEEVPETIMIEENHYVACHQFQHAERFRKEIKDIFGAKTRGV